MTPLLDAEVFRTVLENLPVGVYLVGLDRKILFWNEGAERIAGYLRQEVVGRFCHDDILAHCDNQDAVLCGARCPLAATIRDGRPVEAGVYLRHKAGHRVPVHVRNGPLRNQHGIVIGATSVFDEAWRPTGTGSRSISELCGPIEKAGCLADWESARTCLVASLEDFEQRHIGFGALAIKVDGLDRIGRTYGVTAVETILPIVAQTIAKNIRPADWLGLWPPDRHFVILAACPPTGVAGAAERLKRIVSLAAVSWWGDRLSVTVSEELPHSLAIPQIPFWTGLSKRCRRAFLGVATSSP